MKKKCNWLFFIFISFFIFSVNVNAEELATCVYDFSLNQYKGKITCKVEESSVSCSTGDKNLTVDTSTVALTPVNFQANKVWKCPDKLYYENGTNGAGGTASRPALKNLNNSSGSVSATLNSSESSDGGNLSGETPIGNNSAFSCKYGSLVVTYSNNNINVSNSTCIVSSSFKASDFANGCPISVWIYKNNNYCTYSIGRGVAGGWVDLNGDDPVLDANNNNVSGDKKEPVKSDPTYYTGCPLGEDVTKDLYGALKIFKIAAPLLVIGFTIFEFVKALAKGDITSELKKLSQRLLKRCIYAVILFFLPVLVNQIMQLANVWDENGTCDFSNSVEVKTDDSRTEEERRITSCAGHSDLTSCNNDTTNKCKWSYSGNFCEYKK